MLLPLRFLIGFITAIQEENIEEVDVILRKEKCVSVKKSVRKLIRNLCAMFPVFGMLTYVVLSIVIAMVFIDKSTDKEVGYYIISFRQRIVLQMNIVEMLFVFIACFLFFLVKS